MNQLPAPSRSHGARGRGRLGGGVAAVSSVKLGAAEGVCVAELRTFPPSPPRAAGDREKPSLLWSLWRLSMWVGRRVERAVKGP